MKLVRRSRVRAVPLILLGAIAAIASLMALAQPGSQSGFKLDYRDGQVVVGSIDYGSAAQMVGVRSGDVVTWLDGQYVLAMSDEAKRDVAQTRGPWATMLTIAPDQAAGELATYNRLVAVARQSSLPWLAHPETSPVPGCYFNGACPYGQFVVLPDGSGYYYAPFSLSPDGSSVCFPSDTSGTSIVTNGAVGPDGVGRSISAGWGPEFCVVAAAMPGSPAYGYIGAAEQMYSQGDWNPRSPGSGPTLLGLAVLLLGWLAVSRGWAGASLKPYALTLPLATAVPLLTVSIDRYPAGAVVIAGAILVPLAMLPLAIDFLGRLDRSRLRALLAAVTVGLALASAFFGLRAAGDANYASLVWWAFFAGCVPFVPGVFAARPLHRLESGAVPGRLRWRGVVSGALALFPGRYPADFARHISAGSAASSGPTPRALVERVDILLASMTPGIAALCLTSTYSVPVEPLLWWLAALLIATRLIVRPLGRLATVAVRQRDLLVAATERERGRIAADIHDDALQDLTMLVRRLDAAGDTENAQAAREIAERLRAICGDLRLPVLDDLGVGPALEWLCGRLSPAGVPITLDRLAGESRLPADVELAVFRVAQEALSNAIRHGAAPVVVRYRAREAWVELEVDDAGAGLPDGAAEAAEQTGHLGLLNMTQRSEAVGARLSIRRRPGGGTRVAFVWEGVGAPVPAAAAAAPA